MGGLSVHIQPSKMNQSNEVNKSQSFGGKGFFLFFFVRYPGDERTKPLCFFLETKNKDGSQHFQLTLQRRNIGVILLQTSAVIQEKHT